MRRAFFSVFLLLVSALLPAQVTLVSPEPAKTGGDMLPNEFLGWRAEKAEKFSLAELGAFAGEDAEVLRECGFLGAERKQFVHLGSLEQTAHLTVEAVRLRDASGAYGVFTYYRQPGWRTESGKFHTAIGGGQGLLLRNSYLLRILGHEPSMDELAKLASALPTFEDEPLPPLREFLPPQDLVRGSLQYMMGPRAFARLVPQIPAASVGFNMGAEAQLAHYKLPGKAEMTLLLVLYPTPQIAQARIKQWGDLSARGIHGRRTGSLLSFVLDAPAQADADLLLSRLNYSMDVTWNEPVPKYHGPTLVELILNIFILCGILVVFAFASGVAFGGLRLLTKHFYPGRVFDRDIEIIRLHLTD